MSAPGVNGTRISAARSAVKSSPLTPRKPRATRPDFRICSAIWRARLIGIAKPTFIATPGLMIAELMPMTSPLKLKSGPPELPWLIAASVWMKSS